MYQLIATLITAGWSKVSDSDGTTYSAGGTQVTSGASGANGLGNSSAWVRLAAPAVSGQVRELIFQHVNSSNNQAWSIKYSASALFSGGSPAATVTPTSTDEVYMLGAGTAATALAGWFNTDGAYRWHIACGGSAEFYSFNAFAVLIGSASYQNGLFLDVMAAGSFPSADVDPAVMYCSGEFNGGGYGSQITFGHIGGGITTATNPAHARAWMGALSLAQASLVSNNQRVGMQPYGGTAGSTIGGTTTAGTNPFTSKDSLLPAWWVRPGASTVVTGVKGASTLFSFGSALRNNLDTADTVGTKDKIYIGGVTTTSNQEQVWAPWSGVSPTI
jgi:hypothetical protein